MKLFIVILWAAGFLCMAMAFFAHLAYFDHDAVGWLIPGVWLYVAAITFMLPDK